MAQSDIVYIPISQHFEVNRLEQFAYRLWSCKQIAVSMELSLSLSLSRLLLLEYTSTLTYIRTCTVIHMSTCCHVALLGLAPSVASLQGQECRVYSELILQLHFDVVAEHCYTRDSTHSTELQSKWQQHPQQQGQPAYSPMTLQAYTGTNWPHHPSMVTTVSTRIGNTSS